MKERNDAPRPPGRPAVMIVMACAAILAGCSDEAPERPAVVRPVKIMEIHASGAGSLREYPGFVRAVKSAEVGFEVPGRIVSLNANEGQSVEAGAVLGTLDDTAYRADLDVALADLSKARSDLRRSESVLAEDPGAITAQRIDADRRALEIAEARVAQARKIADDAQLRAPFAGVVSRRLVEVFENVQAKQPVLIIEDLEEMEVQVNVPERDVIGHPGDHRADQEDLDELTRRVAPVVRLSALPDLEFPGRIREIATRADPSTRTFAARISFDAPESLALLPGMTARVIAAFQGEASLAIPVSALAAAPDSRPRVWVVDPDTMTVSAREVSLGPVSGDSVEVTGGLEEGEMIATSGVASLAEGMQVRRFEGAF